MKLPLLVLSLAAAAVAQLDFGGNDPEGVILLEPDVVAAPPDQPVSPLTVFFEEDHYTNKAAEEGFCEYHCGSERRPTVVKPGRCPAEQPRPGLGCADFTDQCTYDSECPGAQRCCFDGCARVCVDPDLRKRCEDISCPQGTACVEYPPADARCVSTETKSGRCPAPLPEGSRVSCETTCQYDSECDAGDKCCYNGCAFQCLKPRKPGCEETKCRVGFKCEEDRYGNPECKPIPCEQDGEVVDIECNSCTCIQGFLLCSQEECPPTKPGFCPKIVRGYMGVCLEECSSDYDCADDSKCCSTGCGHTCQAPIPEIVHPCKTVRFRCGKQTRCAATRALCRPGETCPLVPLCVSKRAPYCDRCPDGKVCVLQKKYCSGGGACHRQPICIQLYSDDTIFEENELLEQQVVANQQSRDAENSVFF
ncbi:WAP four-disulfide core domain protein 18 [Amphibalanus amphitrite]|uniref:WAP four-disulfide core domain protein 18 n=1 Tax=Amphibalanus amphitrite TaxID=1232801 RepID=A0A6A4WHH4_AMPAM|nr:WAP four-disulfide core domain protein 18 [Amphibalanus amphitrite]